MSISVKKILSGNGLSKNSNLNNALILIGGASIAYLAYTFFMNQSSQKVAPTKTMIQKNIDPSTGKPYPRLSMMARAFETTTTTTPPDTTAIKQQILSTILNNASNITTVISNLETIKAKIETYTGQLELVLQQKAAGTLSQYQIDQYVKQLVIDIATALQISLNPYFTGTAGTNSDGSTGIPGYYNDYMQYLNDLYQRYFQYYQPNVTNYYPGQSYDYYQPYSYQYNYPYYPSNVYPGSSSQGFSQGYYPYLQSQFPNQYGYGYGQQSPYGQYYQQNPYGSYSMDPYSQYYSQQYGGYF